MLPGKHSNRRKQSTGSFGKSWEIFKSNYDLKYAINSWEIEIETIEMVNIQGIHYVIILSINWETNS